MSGGITIGEHPLPLRAIIVQGSAAHLVVPSSTGAMGAPVLEFATDRAADPAVTHPLGLVSGEWMVSLSVGQVAALASMGSVRVKDDGRILAAGDVDHNPGWDGKPSRIVVDRIIYGGGSGGGVSVSSLDDVPDSATRKAMTAAERTKLAGVATNATANSTDAQLRDRSTHTGAQPLSSLSQSGATANQVPQWNGSAWAPATVTASGSVPDATTTTKGIVELATTAETTTGTDTARAVTPAGVKAVGDTKVPATRTVNSKPLSANVSLTAADVGAAASSHTHDDRYYTEAEVDSLIAGVSGGGGTSPALKTVWATPTPAGIQAAINSTTEGDPKVIMIPAGTYNMADLAADRLVIPQASRAVLRGESFGSTRLLGVPGQPVISFENKYAHSWLIEELHLYYATQQTGTVPAIRAGGLVEDEEGTFHNHFRRLRIEKAAVAFGLTRGAGKQTSWDLLFEQCAVESCYTHVLDFDPQTPIGVPIIRWRGGSVMNHGQMPTSGYVGGAAFNLVATELFVDGLDIEGWHGPLLVAQGGSPASMKAIHCEHHRLHAGQRLAYMANGPLSISEVSISGQTVDGTPSCFVTEAGGHLDMASSTMVWTGSTSTGILTRASGGTGVVRKSVKWPYGGGFQRGTAPYDLDSTDALSGGGVQIADTEISTTSTWSSSKIAAYVAAHIGVIGGGGGATAPTVTTTSLNALGQGAAFSQTLAATGTAPITWAVTAGTLPAGLSLSAGGVLSGTPTGSGAYSFTVTATNSAGSDTQQYTGTVTATGSLFVATEPRTVFIGDSITASDSTSTGDRGTSYPNIASILTMGRLRYWQNRGVGGEQTPAMVSRFAAQVTGATPKPGVVVIMGGTNDTASGGGDIPTIMGNLDTMVQAAKTAGIQPILCAPPPTRNAAQAAKLLSLRDAIAAYTQCHTVTATFDALKDTDGLLKPAFNDDNIHPSSLGLHELGVALAGALPTNQLPPPVPLSTTARPAGTLVASGINCLAAVDTNSDGLADGVIWVGAAPGTTTASLVAGAPGGGNWQRANINVSSWSTLFRINFDLSTVPDGGRCVLAARMRWDSTGQVGLNCYYPPLTNGFVKVIANDGKRHYPWTDGVASIELVKVAGQNSASFQWNCFPGTGTLDITQFTGYTL